MKNKTHGYVSLRGAQRRSNLCDQIASPRCDGARNDGDWPPTPITKKASVLLFPLFLCLLSLVSSLSSPSAFAQDDETDSSDPAAEARKAHKLAESDVIYQQQDWRAIYYQNLQIIQLLGDIRDQMRIQNERSAENDKK